MATTLTFEHPLNERARTQMRLEHLFEKLAYLQPQDNPWASRALVETLLDIATISSRADIKTELIKELDRQAATLERVRDKPGVSRKALEGFLAESTPPSRACATWSAPSASASARTNFSRA